MTSYYEFHIPIDPVTVDERVAFFRQLFLERYGHCVIDPSDLFRDERRPDGSVVTFLLRRVLVPAPDDSTARFLAAEIARICGVEEVTMLLPHRPVERVPRSRWATLWRAGAH